MFSLFLFSSFFVCLFKSLFGVIHLEFSLCGAILKTVATGWPKIAQIFVFWVWSSFIPKILKWWVPLLLILLFVDKDVCNHCIEWIWITITLSRYLVSDLSISNISNLQVLCMTSLDRVRERGQIYDTRKGDCHPRSMEELQVWYQTAPNLHDIQLKDLNSFMRLSSDFFKTVRVNLCLMEMEHVYIKSK